MLSHLATLRDLPTRLWFIPAVLCLLGVVLAEGLVSIDQWWTPTDGNWLTSFMFTVGVSGARSLLNTIGTSAFGVAGTAFSITISVIATTSSTYGPRLVRNFMSDRGNQFVLGTFGATFIYSLLVVRHVKAADEQAGSESFIPHIAVNFALVLAVLNVALLVYFIHHIASSVEVSTLTEAVRVDLVRTIEHIYPEDPADAAGYGVAVPLPGGKLPQATLTEGPPARRIPVRSPSSGYVTEIYEDALARLATGGPWRVEMHVGPGDLVVAGQPLAYVELVEEAAGATAVAPDSGEATDSHEQDGRDRAEDLAKRVCGCVHIHHTRSANQDIRYSLERLVEMAVRALSSGTNDPYTAVNAIHEVTIALTRLADRPDPWQGRAADEKSPVHLALVRIPRADLVRMAFREIRPSLDTTLIVLGAMVDMGTVLYERGDDSIRACVEEQFAILTEQIEAADMPGADRDVVLERMSAVPQR